MSGHPGLSPKDLPRVPLGEINLLLSDNVMICHTLCVKFVEQMSTVGTITGAITLIKCTVDLWSEKLQMQIQMCQLG